MIGNLAILLARYSNTQTFGKIKYLNEAIELEDRAIRTLSSSNSNFGMHLIQLANHLETRHEINKDMDDFERAIKLGEIGIECIPRQHSAFGIALDNHGSHLFTLYMRTNAPQHLSESIEASCRALRHIYTNPLQRIKSARAAAMKLIFSAKYAEAAQILKEAMDILPRIASRAHSHEDLEQAIKSVSGLSAITASVFLIIGRPAVDALQILERGRGIISGLSLDSKSDVSLLKDSHPQLWADYVRLQEALVGPSATPVGQELRHTLTVSSVKNNAMFSQQYEHHLEELKNIETKIRNQQGFERFQLNPTDKELLDSAERGTLISFNISPILSSAFIVTKTAVRAISLPKEFGDKEFKKRFPFFINGRPYVQRDLALVSSGDKSKSGGSYPLMTNSGSSLRWLWETAVKPVLHEAGLLQEDKPPGRLPRVWWVGGGLMALASVHAAGIHTEGSTESTMSHVVSSFVPTFKSLKVVRNKPWAPLKQQSHSILITSMSTTPKCAPLNVAEEVEAINRAVSSWATVIHLQNPNKEMVISHLKSCKVAHFACHGQFDPIRPSIMGLEDCSLDVV